MYQDRLPLVPPDILQAHMVHEPGDTRFKAAARLLQALWRAERGIEGSSQTPRLTEIAIAFSSYRAGGASHASGG